jgi:type II secretory pathway component GspD/PulD (secretin)
MTLLRSRIAQCVFTACALIAITFPCAAIAQSTTNESKNTESRPPEITETIYVSSVTGINDVNDIQTALRNCFPRIRTFGMPAQYAIAVRATAEDMQGVKKMVAELDRPQKIYRVTYNVSDVENGKRTGTQHYSLVVTSGGKTTLKQGNRVPLVTGLTGESPNPAQSSQIQYVDVGLNIDASIEGTALKTKIEQSGISEEKSGVTAPDPVIRQTMLEGTSALTAGKPVVLGSLDVPGTTRRQEIEVVTEVLTQ